MESNSSQNELVPASPTSVLSGAATLQPLELNTALEVFGRNPIVTRLTKIEEYNLDHVAWELFWSYSKNYADIAYILNKELENRKRVLSKRGMLPPEMRGVVISVTDVVLYLRRISQKVTDEEARKQRAMLRRAWDTIKQFEAVLAKIHEAMDVWTDIYMDKLADQTPEQALPFYRVVQQDRSQLVSTLKILNDMKLNVTTHISIDLLRSQVKKMIDIVVSADGLPYEQADKILNDLEEVLHAAGQEEA